MYLMKNCTNTSYISKLNELYYISSMTLEKYLNPSMNCIIQCNMRTNDFTQNNI